MGQARTGPAVIAGALAVTLVAEAVAVATLLGQHALLLTAVSAPLWLLAVWLVSKLHLPGRRMALLLLGVGVLLQVVAVTRAPATSDDSYRYTWDAKVQLAGIDPYRYPPSAPALAPLRDGSLFGPPDHCTYAFPGGCTSINRPTVHTIYPPVAEGAFDIVRLVSFGGHGGQLPLQLAGLLGSLAVGWLLLRRARARPWLVALWSWCPVVVVEYANNAHIDWLGVLLVVLAFSVRGVRWAGALVGAAIAVKLYPVLVLPSLLRRSWVAAAAAAAVVVAVYVPHVIAVGSAVLGYLPGYLSEEQYGSGGRLLLLGAVLPHPADTAVGAVLVLAVAVWAWRRGSRAAPERSAVIVVGVTFLTFTPSYGWYAGLLLALVVLTGALEWLPVVLAPTLTYLDHGGHDAAYYAAALLLTLLVAAGRHRAQVRCRVRSLINARAGPPGPASGRDDQPSAAPHA